MGGGKTDKAEGVRISNIVCLVSDADKHRAVCRMQYVKLKIASGAHSMAWRGSFRFGDRQMKDKARRPMADGWTREPIQFFDL